jgi:NAD-dependent SIR2 family protein deacetylase
MDFSSIQAAAQALAQANRVVISTGAGMSADSGIPTYRDRNGRWRDFLPFSQVGLTPSDFAHPPGYRERPQHAWAFAEYLRRSMAQAPVHQGYDVLTEWMLRRIPQSFLLTTNIDDLHRRANVPETKFYERYGNLWELQCLERCTPHWWRENRVELCTLDTTTMEASNFPQCPFCQGLARPRIQMAYDEEFVEKEAGWKFYQNFLASGPIDVYLIIGTTLWMTWPEGQEPNTIIHINPAPNTHEHYQSPVAVTMGAKDALVGIDWAWRQLGKG